MSPQNFFLVPELCTKLASGTWGQGGKAANKPSNISLESWVSPLPSYVLDSN